MAVSVERGPGPGAGHTRGPTSADSVSLSFALFAANSVASYENEGASGTPVPWLGVGGLTRALLTPVSLPQSQSVRTTMKTMTRKIITPRATCEWSGGRRGLSPGLCSLALDFPSGRCFLILSRPLAPLSLQLRCPATPASETAPSPVSPTVTTARLSVPAPPRSPLRLFLWCLRPLCVLLLSIKLPSFRECTSCSNLLIFLPVLSYFLSLCLFVFSFYCLRDFLDFVLLSVLFLDSLFLVFVATRETLSRFPNGPFS